MVKLSKEYGVNPSVLVCSCCGKDMGVALLGASYKVNGKTAEAPRRMATGQICDDCRKVIENGGIFVIEVKDGEKGPDPYRTGRLIAIKEEAANRMFRQHGKINYMEERMFSKVFNEIEFDK